MLLRRYYDDKLAQASYMIGCQASGEALIVDPNRDVQRYLDAARDEDMRIRYVSETHIHADYLSGSRELARRAGATLLLSGDGPPDWQYGFADEDGVQVVHHGDEIQLGNIRIEILHTPGHTPEHISFSITDGATSDEPMGVLTGDFVFVGDVGRPDLLEKAAGVRGTMEEGARSLYRSLRDFRDRPDYLQILPGHGAGSACGKALGAVPTSTLGYEKLVNWAFQSSSEEAFVGEVLSDQPEPPVYFAMMKRLNRDGPPMLDGLPDPESLDAEALGDALAEDTIVVDVRPPERFRAGHVAGTLSIPLNNSFPNWAGWLVPYGLPIYLVAEGGAQAREAARDLALIGLDDVVGFFGPEALDSWQEGGGGIGTLDEITWSEAERLAQDDEAFLLDVRRETEWNEGHVKGARHIHLGYLADHMDEVPGDRRILVYCRTGARSAIGASLLKRAGFESVVNVAGGIVERAKQGLPIERPATRDTFATQH